MGDKGFIDEGFTIFISTLAAKMTRTSSWLTFIQTFLSCCEYIVILNTYVFDRNIQYAALFVPSVSFCSENVTFKCLLSKLHCQKCL